MSFILTLKFGSVNCSLERIALLELAPHKGGQPEGLVLFESLSLAIYKTLL